MITNNYIAKIEGHGSLDIDWTNNKVKLNIHEGERLFEGILVGRHYEEAHWITPRICGVCPIAHNLASLAATEDALGIKISETSRLLRELMQCGQMIQSHVLHLFFLVLPDYIGIDRATELAQKDPDAFKKALSLKELGDEIAKIVAGRNVHPTATAVGGFHKIPSKEELESLLKKLEETEKMAEWTVKLFSGLKYPELKVELYLVAIEKGKIISVSGEKTDIKEYKNTIQEELKEYSTAKFGRYKGKEMLVGSLARLATDSKNVGHLVSNILDFKNPFHNNLAQAIEILNYHILAQEIIEKLVNTGLVSEKDEYVASENSVKSIEGLTFLNGERTGIGAVEAPRGGLYHEIRLDKDGIITYANIITPTVQNLTSIEKSAHALLEQIEEKNNKKRERLLNMLVRAYDPCITCSVH